METHYTPEIEEFHVGFEFECKESFLDGTVKTLEDFNNSKWVKQTCGSAIMYVERALIGRNAKNGLSGVRVKYLDKEDIESLRFEYQDGKMIKGYSDNFIYKPNNNLQYDLTYVYDKNILRIHVEDLVYFEDSYNYLYQGIIKNKSELKKLLKQLNIL